MSLRLAAASEKWPIAGTFTISRGAKTEARVVVATVTDGTHTGRGECVPYARYGESVDSVLAAIEAMAPALAAGCDRAALQESMPAGAARNAIDCALVDLAAKRAGVPAHALFGLPAPQPLVTAYTISLGAPDAMADAAAAAAARPLLKVKLGGGPQDPERIAAVRRAVPGATLIVDANEGWTEADLAANLAACAAAGVQLVEQPLPAADDAALARVPHPVPVCADESVHGGDTLARLRDRYDAVNIKLDKTGGLTEALVVAAAARALGFEIMVGCMVSTSLAIAPAVLLAQGAGFVDLDGPLLLVGDRPHGLVFDGSVLHPATPLLWG
ncbi:dipeptide epimerase [Rhodoplanes sp. TEM]|uniref:Dipeptide epimerase n=1 Tax=Rhodoplanes tepidamans TaxID=200616 RepID=A0ABT5JAH0_RHOTP|nr:MULTISPECIES: N-acetyl-D-Glu racemase DgcA [Rhodoplanes]MDC7786654.1 dipeptide epimerase [Rhodoplanes tepidamans]MDC7982999.1 dipeptide epimerase [Rhodoplanes sp. TEM]MDQ0356381.1 L-alanine-DL-glutamate epimerase-like enolase superfamily enzyme [Rhodoplanes tepidamans]